MMNAQIKKFSQQDWIMASGLFLLGLITRIPFACRMLYHSDSARFALAMEHYDVAQMRPHAPGYILYVATAKLADLFVHDQRASLVGVSIISSALTAAFLYFLASKIFGRSTALISGLVLVSSPLFWFNSEMPFTYALEGLLAILFVYSCYQMIIGKGRWLVVSAILLGLATGVRQNIIVMLLPLWLYALRKYSFKQILTSFLVFGLTCLAWFTPLIVLSGGLRKYIVALHSQFNMVVLYPAPYIFEIKVRTVIFAKFMVYSLGLGLMPMVYYFGRFFRIPSVIKDVRLKFLLIWLVPAVLFYIAVNIYNSGQVVVILPPLMIFLAESVKGLARDLEEGFKGAGGNSFSSFAKSLKSILSYKPILVSTVILLLFFNFYIFLFGSTRVSYAAIKGGDSHLSEFIRLTEESTIPEKTMILALFYNTQAAFYLPDYLIYCPLPIIFSDSEIPVEAQNVYISRNRQTTPKTYWISTGFRIEPIPVPEGVDTVILWEKDVAQYYQNSGRALGEIGPGRDGTKIYFLKVKPEEKIYYDYHYWSVKEDD